MEDTNQKNRKSATQRRSSGELIFDNPGSGQSVLRTRSGRWSPRLGIVTGSELPDAHHDGASSQRPRISPPAISPEQSPNYRPNRSLDDFHGIAGPRSARSLSTGRTSPFSTVSRSEHPATSAQLANRQVHNALEILSNHFSKSKDLRNTADLGETHESLSLYEVSSTTSGILSIYFQTISCSPGRLPAVQTAAPPSRRSRDPRAARPAPRPAPSTHTHMRTLPPRLPVQPYTAAL